MHKRHKTFAGLMLFETADKSGLVNLESARTDTSHPTEYFCLFSARVVLYCGAPEIENCLRSRTEAAPHIEVRARGSIPWTGCRPLPVRSNGQCRDEQTSFRESEKLLHPACEDPSE